MSSSSHQVQAHVVTECKDSCLDLDIQRLHGDRSCSRLNTAGTSATACHLGRQLHGARQPGNRCHHCKGYLRLLSSTVVARSLAPLLSMVCMASLSPCIVSEVHQVLWPHFGESAENLHSLWADLAADAPPTLLKVTQQVVC